MPKLVASGLSRDDFDRLKLQASKEYVDAKASALDASTQASVADEWRSSFFSRLTFSWLFPLIRLGKTRTLTEDDIGENISKDNVMKYLAKFEENLKKSKPENIASTIWKTFSHRELSAVMCKLISDIMSYLPPLCINFIVEYAGNQNEWQDHEIFLVALVMLIAPLITGLCNHWFYQFVMNDGLHARTTIQAAVYSKILRISNTARTRKVADGGVADMVTNLQSTDCRSIEMVYWMWMYVWAAPLQVVITTILLYLLLGWVVLVGIGVLLLLIPVQKCMMSSLKELTATASAASDQRIKLITEVIHGVQVVKLQAWESMFAERVEKARALELKTRRRIAFLQGINTAITESSAVLSTVATFVTYGLAFDTPLTPGKTFTTLALFNILRTPITVLPMLIGMVAGGLVASKRLARFLYSDDTKSYVKRGTHSPKNPGFTSVVVKNASFTWGDSSPLATATTKNITISEGNPFTLSIADLNLTPGTLCVIAGKVGAGKSSFLAALIGEMVLTDNAKAASVELNGSVAFCSQEPWIQSASLRDNILFGRPYNAQRYRTVLQACALEEDIAALPGGDETEIGERGINLSGGQKARVSLGRACYADTDIIILDDILSAVDAHVARTITDKCLVALLRNQGKTVVLATHQILCFPEADRLIVLKDGLVDFAGLYADAPEYAGTFAKTAGVTGPQESNDVDEMIAVDENNAAVKSEAKDTGETPSDAKKKEDGNLIKKEDPATGAVTSKVYLAYISMMGNVFFIVVVLLAMMLNVQQILVNWWLSRWSVASEDPNNSRSVLYYLWIYFALGLGACALILLYQLVSAFSGLRAAARIHARMFIALLGAPLSFFDTTPSGRLLNLFTADIKAIDETLITQLSGSLSLIFMMLAVIGTVVSVVPVVIVPLIPLFWFYGWVQWIYRNTARELKRFDSATQSPVFNHYAESLNGLSTIRAFQCEKRMLLETQRRVDYNSRFWTKNNFVNRWLGLRLDWIGASLVGSTAMACVLVIRFDIAALDPGLVGLVLSYTATLTGLLNWGVRRFSEAELGMVAVERTRKLFSCPQEETTSPTNENPVMSKEQLPADWPSSGEMRLTNVTARYRPGLPPVLRDVSIHIPKFSKVGVCGRTGSGKTTLAKCLFRLMEVASGTIQIDGINIAQVRLRDLRSKITMIPQDPTLFAGPLRYSLDPFGIYSDALLWEALTAVDLAAHIKAHLSGGLEADVAQGGENWSAGQRQLLCLARALLEKPKLMVMDEATSNIDSKTDDKIQAMLQSAFVECSVLTIAHRIDTIMWYDKVLVLDQGSVLEYDSPKDLAQKEGSAFGALLAEYSKGKKN